MLVWGVFGTTLMGLASVRAAMTNVPATTELERIYLTLEGLREKCLVEDLPTKTVVLVKHSAIVWNTQTQTRSDASMQLLVTVRDPTGHTVVRQQSRPADRLFHTASMTGKHLICFQAMLTQYVPNTLIKLGLEVFIGEAGDPHITSPVEAQLSDLSFQISKTSDQASDLQREQTLQRDREAEFRQKSERVNSKVLRWALLQGVILALTAWMQVHHLRRFFRHKKLV